MLTRIEALLLFCKSLILEAMAESLAAAVEAAEVEAAAVEAAAEAVAGATLNMSSVCAEDMVGPLKLSSF